MRNELIGLRFNLLVDMRERKLDSSGRKHFPWSSDSCCHLKLGGKRREGRGTLRWIWLLYYKIINIPLIILFHTSHIFKDTKITTLYLFSYIQTHTVKNILFFPFPADTLPSLLAKHIVKSVSGWNHSRKFCPLKYIDVLHWIWLIQLPRS